jgi:hypothetical protein
MCGPATASGKSSHLETCTQSLIYAVAWTGKCPVKDFLGKIDLYFKCSNRSSYLEEAYGKFFCNTNVRPDLFVCQFGFCALIWGEFIAQST